MAQTLGGRIPCVSCLQSTNPTSRNVSGATEFWRIDGEGGIEQLPFDEVDLDSTILTVRWLWTADDLADWSIHQSVNSANKAAKHAGVEGHTRKVFIVRD